MKRASRVCAIWLVALWMTVQGRTEQLVEAGRPLHFLFVLEVSQEMTKRKPASARTIRDLVASGFHDRIQDGEQFGIWIVADGLKTNVFPNQTWRESERIAQAELAATFVRSLSSTQAVSSSGLALALSNAASSSTPLTLFHLGDGSQPVTGVFSKEVRAIYEKNTNRMRRERKPFLTTFLHLGGERVAWGVHANEGVIELPNFPFRLPIPSTRPAPSPPAPVLAVTEKPPASEPVAERKLEEKPPLAKEPVAEQPKQEQAPPAPLPTPAPKVIEPSPVSVAPPIASPKVEPPAAAVIEPVQPPQPNEGAGPRIQTTAFQPTEAPEPVKKDEPKTEAVVPAPANASEVHNNIVNERTEPPARSNETPEKSVAAAPLDAMSASKPSSKLWSWAAVAGLSMGLVVLLIAWLGRKRPPARSLISQTMPDKQRP